MSYLLRNPEEKGFGFEEKSECHLTKIMNFKNLSQKNLNGRSSFILLVSKRMKHLNHIQGLIFIQFFEENYCAQNLKLMIKSNKTINELPPDKLRGPSYLF